MMIFLLVAQLLSALLLLYVGLPMPGVRDSSGKLTSRGRICLTVGALSLVTFIIGDAISTERNERRHQEQVEALFTQISRLVMLIEPSGVQEPPGQPATGVVSILDPGDRETVQSRHRVTGTVEAPASTVWLVVHPRDTGAYWVQPRVATTKTGNWAVEAYFGREGNIDIGREFEILAIAGPRQELLEGQVLPDWPEAAWRSRIVTVVRRAAPSSLSGLLPVQCLGAPLQWLVAPRAAGRDAMRAECAGPAHFS